MLLAIGTRVRLRFTGENGTVTARLSDEMLQVRLDNDPDFLIPAFEEDLEKVEEFNRASAASLYMPPKKDAQPAPPPRRVIKSHYHILKPKGLQLAFEPMPGKDESVSRYKVWLINDTQFDFLLEFDLYSTARDILFLDEKIGAETALEVGDFLSDDLNDAPEVYLNVRRITTAGPDEALESQLRIRPKQFFNSLSTAPILNVLSYQYVMIDNFEPKQAQSDGSALKEYAKQHQQKPKKEGGNNLYKAFDPEAFATFEPEIDLHIQNLMNGYARLDKGEIVRIQLMHFQRFLDKAVRLGAPRVFVIHGVGEGKLKDAIAERLADNPHVKKFKNEYHHKYGYGATEVVLQ
jgi:hypothetical protein